MFKTLKYKLFVWLYLKLFPMRWLWDYVHQWQESVYREIPNPYASNLMAEYEVHRKRAAEEAGVPFVPFQKLPRYNEFKSP